MVRSYHRRNWTNANANITIESNDIPNGAIFMRTDDWSFGQ